MFAKEKEKKEQIEKLFNDSSKGLGLILNERMINIPPELAPPLHKMLYEEMENAVEEEVFLNPISNPSIRLDYIISYG